MTTPSVVLTGYPPPILTWPGGYPNGGVLCWGSTLPGYPPAGYPPSWPGPGGYPTWVPPWQGTPQGPPILTWSGGVPYLGTPPAGYAPGQGTPPAGPGRVSPPSVCPMAFWEMLQSIMGYGYPPLWTDRWKDRRMSKHYLPVVLRTRAVKITSILMLVSSFFEHVSLLLMIISVSKFKSECPADLDELFTHRSCFFSTKNVWGSLLYCTRILFDKVISRQVQKFYSISHEL